MSGPERRPAARARRWLGRRRWDLERFGLTPRGLADRINPPAAPRVVAISIPKAGTHLLERAICLHPAMHRRLTRKVLPAELDRLERLLAQQRPGELICGHIHHSERAEAIVRRDGTELVFVVRNPRDIVVSQAHYVYTNTSHQWHQHVAAMPDIRERVAYFIDGDPGAGIASIGGVLDLYLGWLAAGARTCRFEDFADGERRVAALSQLFGDLGVDNGLPLCERISGELVSPKSVTFRSGRAGGWSEVFDDALEARYREVVGDRPHTIGYE